MTFHISCGEQWTVLVESNVFGERAIERSYPGCFMREGLRLGGREVLYVPSSLGISNACYRCCVQSLLCGIEDLNVQSLLDCIFLIGCLVQDLRICHFSRSRIALYSIFCLPRSNPSLHMVRRSLLTYVTLCNYVYFPVAVLTFLPSSRSSLSEHVIRG